MRWMRFNENGQESELPSTLALVRMHGKDGDALARSDGVEEMVEVGS